MIEIKNWLREKIAEETGMKIENISCDQEFSKFALDSLSLITLAFELEKVLDEDLSPTLFTEFNTINKLADWYTAKV